MNSKRSMYVDISVEYGLDTKLRDIYTKKPGHIRQVSFNTDGYDREMQVTLGFNNITNPVIGMWFARRLVKKISLPLGGTGAEYRVWYGMY